MDNNNNNYDSKKDENIWRFGRVRMCAATNFGFTARQDGAYKCMLCNHMANQWLSEDEKEDHEEDIYHFKMAGYHRETAEKLATCQMSRIDDLIEMDEVKFDLQRLGCVIIPDSIKELFAKYFMDKGTKHTICIEARQLCNSYMTKEPLVLLELALWKTACLCNPSQEDFTASGMAQFFLCGGWKKNKTTSRHNQLIEIVLTNVLPFLGFRKIKIANSTKKRKLSSA